MEPTSAPGARGVAGDADEFANIPDPRRVRSPIIAIAAIALAGYLLYRLQPDLSYALNPTVPQNLGDARRAAQHLPVPNHYITLVGAPDRSNAAFLDTRGKDDYRQFFRLLGTGSRLLVLRTFGAIPKERALDDEFTGRLVAFRDLSFATSIGDWYQKRIVASHFLQPADVQARVTLDSFGMLDLAGDPVEIAPDSALALDLIYSNEYRIVVPSGTFAGARAARQALGGIGFAEVASAPLPVGGMTQSAGRLVLVGRPFEHMRRQVLETLQTLGPGTEARENPADPSEIYVAVPAAMYPDGLPQARRALEARGLVGANPPPLIFVAKVAADRRDEVLGRLEELPGGISIMLRTETFEGTWASLRKSHSTAFGKATRVKLVAPLKIPPDAQVLIEGDTPSRFWYVPLLYVALGTFLALNLYTLWAGFFSVRRAPQRTQATT